MSDARILCRLTRCVHRLPIALAVMGAALASGCGDGPSAPPAVAAVVITTPASPPTLRTLGRTVQFSAEARTGLGAPLPDRVVSWSSSDGAVASITPAGLLAAVGPGTTQVTATVEDRSSTPVLVTVAPVTASLSLTPAAVSFATKGRTAQLVFELRDSSGALVTEAPLFRSDAPAVAAVDAFGLVRAEAEGTALIVGTSGNAADTVAVSVAWVVASVAMSPGTLTFGAKGTVRQVTATARDTLGNVITGRARAWMSTDTGVVTVDSAGRATAVSDGTAYVRASVGPATGQTAITVSLVVASVSVSPNPYLFRAVQRSFLFTATPLDSNGNPVNGAPITWNVPGRAIFSVTNSGLVTSRGPGSGLVEARSGVVSGTAGVSVVVEPVAATVSPDSLLLGSIGRRVIASVAVIDSGGGRVVFEPRDAWDGLWWESRDTSVVRLDWVYHPDSTEVIARATGVTWLVVSTWTTVRDSIRIVVRQYPARLSLTPPSRELHWIGQTVQFAVSVQDSGETIVPDPVTTTWSTTGRNRVSVTATGLATARASGRQDSVIATISYPTHTLTTYAPTPVVRIDASVTITSASSTPDTLFTTGRTSQWTAVVRDSVGQTMNASVGWIGLNNAVAWPSQTGLITALSDGIATIEAWSPNAMDTRTIVVRRYASVFNLSSPASQVGVGASMSLTGLARDSANTDLPIAWVSRSPGVATVSASGTGPTVTGVAAGTTWIVMTAGTRSDSVAVNVP